MKIKIFYVLIIICSVLNASDLRAQQPKNLSIALTSETYSFPFTRFLPIHPGLEIGATFLEKSNQNSIHQINLFVGGYHHKNVENGFYLRSEYLYRYNIKNTLSLDGPVGIGYQQTFYPGELYEQDTNTGEWEKKRQIGKPHFLVTFGLGMTYLKTKSVQPFIRYESNIDIPLYNGFLTTRTFFKLGVNIKLNQDETN